jgi:hypothetical protein
MLYRHTMKMINNAAYLVAEASSCATWINNNISKIHNTVAIGEITLSMNTKRIHYSGFNNIFE